jgi:hypothetical protein
MPDDSRSSTGAATPGWVRVAMPSAADLIFVGLLSVLVFTPLSVRLLGDAGIGWHIRTGQQILATHAIPRVDSFSFAMAGRPMPVKPWFAWEWLYDLAVGQLEGTLGLNGVVWLTAVVIAAVFAWMFRLLVARGVNILVALVLVLLAASASTIHFLARPHVLSWLFTLAWFWILDSSERECFDDPGGRGGRAGRRLWTLPLLMLVWVNVHGGFLVGFVLLGIFLVGAVWTWFRANESRIEEALLKIAAGKRARNLAWVGLLSAAASLVNPYGWKLHWHVYSYLSNRFLMDHIDEFQSPNFHGAAQKCFLLLLLITVAVLAVRGRELRLSAGLTVLFAVYAGLYASRNIPVASILLVMVVGPLVPAVELGREFFQRMMGVEVALRGHVWAVLAIVVTLLIAMNGGRVGSSVVMDAHFDAARMPVAAVDYVEKQGIDGPIFCPDYWGGYLIYRFHLHPDPNAEARVLVDDRHDLYGEMVLKEYLRVMHVEEGWNDSFLNGRRVEWLVLPRNGALANALIGNLQWKRAYKDDLAVVFMNESEANQ